MPIKKLKSYSKKKYSKGLKNKKHINNKRNSTKNNKTRKIVKKYKRNLIFNGGTDPSEIPPRHFANIRDDIINSSPPPPPTSFLLMRQNDFQGENNDDSPPNNPPTLQRQSAVSYLPQPPIRPTILSLPQPPDRPTILPIPHHTLLHSSVDIPPLQFRRPRHEQNILDDLLNNNNIR